MTNVRMTALTVLHISSVQAENILTGEEFEVPGYVADELIHIIVSPVRLDDVRMMPVAAPAAGVV